MKKFNVLDGLPQLISGTGKDPEDGGCIMQVVNYLWDRGWDDEPVCVLRSLRGLSISVNDGVDKVERQELWRLIPRLMNTNPTREENEHWIDAFGNIRTSIFTVADTVKAEPLDRHMLLWINDHTPEAGEVNVGFLEAALDEYDKFTGRKASSCKTFDKSYVKDIKETLPKEAFSVQTG